MTVGIKILPMKSILREMLSSHTNLAIRTIVAVSNSGIPEANAIRLIIPNGQSLTPLSCVLKQTQLIFQEQILALAA